MRLPLIALGCAAAVLAAPARAGDLGDILMPPEGWTVTLKANLISAPSYPGAKDNSILFFPSGGIRKAGTPATFSTPDQGVSLALFDIGWLKAGPAASFVGARRGRDHAALLGLNDVDWTIEGGAFVELWPMEQLRTRVELRKGFHGHHGYVADFGADWVVKQGQWTFSAGPRLTLASDDFMRRYFSVSPLESGLSGLPVYKADGGVKSYGATIAAKYDWSKAFSTTLWGRYDRLTGDAAKSPIVRETGSPNQFTVGLIAAYAFDFRGF